MSDSDGPGRREVAYRLFAAEFEDADHSYSESDEERAPNYVVTPSGARVNRLFVVGVLTEVEQVSEDVLRGRVVDPTGAFVLYAGQYQPDEQAFLDRADPPMFVAVTGKARTFQPDDAETVYTSVRPETLSEVDADTRDRWTVDAAERTLDRVAQCAAAARMDHRGDALAAALQEQGVDESLAEGTALALDHYGTTGSYLAALRDLALDAARLVAGQREEVEPLTLDPGAGDDGALTDIAADLQEPDESTVTAEETETETESESETATGMETDTGAGAAESSTGTAGTESPETTASAETTTSAGTSTSTETAGATESPEPTAPETATEDAGAVTGTEAVDESGDSDDIGDSEAIGDFESGGLEGGEDGDDLDDFEPEEFDLDEEEREEIEEEYGTDFQSGTEVDEPGQADIETPDSEPESGSGTAGTPDAEPASGEQAQAESGAAEEPVSAAETESAAGDGPAAEADTGAGSTADSGAEATDAGDSERPTNTEELADEELEDAVVDLMDDLDEGDGVAREELVVAVTDRYGVDAGAAEDAVQDALMGGRCYEPDDGTLKPI